MSQALTAMGAMDPERIAARINRLGDEAERNQVAQIVRGGFTCLTRIQSINFSALERSGGSHAARRVWDDASEVVNGMWLAVEELNTILTPLIDAHEAKQGGDGDELDFDLGEGDTDSSGVNPSGSMTPLERIGETAWATCFVLNGEIQSFRKRLPTLMKMDDGWEMVSHLQDHAGNVKAAVNAILTGVYSSLPTAFDDGSAGEQSAELMSSLELRIRVFELRDGILELEKRIANSPPHEWEKFLRLAVQWIERFMFGPGFAWMRAGDKRTFITQHRSLVEILEFWSPLRSGPAKNALSNLARYLEALEVLNQRELLVEHDREKLETVVRNLTIVERSRDPSDQRAGLARALAALAELEGRDRELDRLISQTLDPRVTVPRDEIFELASALLTKLNGH